MTASAEKIVRDSVYPAYYRAVDGLASMNEKATEDAGLWRLPKGAEAYAFYLRRFTTTKMTAEQIHQKGLDEVARIEAEIRGSAVAWVLDVWRLGYRSFDEGR
jgi:uncharacterized protein (DUF885 family)